MGRGRERLKRKWLDTFRENNIRTLGVRRRYRQLSKKGREKKWRSESKFWEKCGCKKRRHRILFLFKVRQFVFFFTFPIFFFFQLNEELSGKMETSYGLLDLSTVTWKLGRKRVTGGRKSGTGEKKNPCEIRFCWQKTTARTECTPWLKIIIEPIGLNEIFN